MFDADVSRKRSIGKYWGEVACIIQSHSPLTAVQCCVKGRVTEAKGEVAPQYFHNTASLDHPLACDPQQSILTSYGMCERRFGLDDRG